MENTQQKLPIDNLKEAVALAVETTKVGFEVMKDGKVGLDDMGSLMKLIPYVGPAFDNLNQIPLEVKDLDASEAQELLAFVGAKLVVDEPKAQIIVSHSLKILGKAYELAMEAKAMKVELDALKGQVVAG